MGRKYSYSRGAKILTPVDLHDVFVTLQALGLDAIVVGGQAVNLWAYQYQTQCRKLQDFMPFLGLFGSTASWRISSSLLLQL